MHTHVVYVYRACLLSRACDTLPVGYKYTCVRVWMQEEKAMVLRNAGLLELKKVMEEARKKRKPKPKLEENDDDLNW